MININMEKLNIKESLFALHSLFSNCKWKQTVLSKGALFRSSTIYLATFTTSDVRYSFTYSKKLPAPKKNEKDHHGNMS